MASIYPNRKDGKIISFKFKAFLGRDEQGKQIFKCKTWTPQKTMAESKLIAQAEKEAAIWERTISKEIIVQAKEQKASDIPFYVFVHTIWLPSQTRDKEYRASTIAFHSYILKIINDYLGELPINNITSKDIQGYLNYLKNTYKTKQNQSLAPKSIRHHYCTANLIFEYAVKHGYIDVNPVSKVDIPKLVRHKVDALSKGEVQRFIREIEKLPHMQRLLYTLLLTTGMRRGECFGLQWGDIDFDNRTIRIERNVTYTALNGISVGLPKTNTGIRDIPITDGVLQLLNEYRSIEEQEFSLSDDLFLFHSKESPLLPRDPTYITKHMKRFMARIGLPAMSPHDLRHTCASLLLQSGADIKSVQDILGHADASTTLNFYVRSDMDTMRGATDRAFQFG